MSGPLDLARIRAEHPLATVAGAVVKLQRAGKEWKACCPFHQDRSPSFTIYGDGQRYQCFGCGEQGDVLDFIQRLHGVSLRQAADLLTGGDLPSVEVDPVAGHDLSNDRLAEAKAIWSAALPIKGTPAETYLRSRGIDMELPASLRFAELPYGRGGAKHPCLVAVICKADRTFHGTQRTYLRSDGRGKLEVDKPKLSLGGVAGGAIRLAPVAASLVVCEGLEDALTLQQELGLSVWCAAGAGMLSRMQFPPEVRTVAIGGDADDAGREAALKAAQTLAERGLEARVFFPTPPFKDFNQEIQERSRA